MDASGMDKMLKSSELGTRALTHLGKAGMQGVLQQAIGGKFKDGFANSLLSSAASEVGAHLDQQIKAQLPELDPAQASALKLLSRAATSALRIAGSNDPAASFANDFLTGALQDAAADRKRGQEGRDGQEGAQRPGTAQGGEKPSSAWVERLGRAPGSSAWGAAAWGQGSRTKRCQGGAMKLMQGFSTLRLLMTPEFCAILTLKEHGNPMRHHLLPDSSQETILLSWVLSPIRR